MIFVSGSFLPVSLEIRDPFAIVVEYFSVFVPSARSLSSMNFLNSVSVFPAKLVTSTVFSGSTVTVITPASLTVSSFLGFVLTIVPDFASDFLSASTIL